MRQSELDKRRTKIVCTRERATSPMPMIECLIRAGMNVAPLNLGYNTPSEHARYVHSIRNLSKGLHMDVAVLVDLPGPEYRTGKLKRRGILCGYSEFGGWRN